ncbi:hypothetical protein GF323_02755 [Candidatus Woesearchaeota archaeon]|nr:hypothetical protein [Candidatus Woesearchaeota archaeon]
MEKYRQIKQAYEELHRNFLLKNSILVKHLNKRVWAPSIAKEVYRIFQKYGDKEKVFLDLGSGDGIAVMIASLFFKRAYGIEIEKEFFDISLRMKKKIGIHNAAFLNSDFYKADFSKYDILFIAPDSEFTLRLENKVSRELDGKLIVYSSIFQPRTLEQSGHFLTKHFDVFVYENRPKKV